MLPVFASHWARLAGVHASTLACNLGLQLRTARRAGTGAHLRRPCGGSAGRARQLARRSLMVKSPVVYLNPPNAPPVQGLYSHVARVAPGELAFIAGQVAIDAAGNPVGVGDLALQVEQAFANLGTILKDLGTSFEAVAQFTTYLTRSDSIPTFMAARAQIFARVFADGRYPPNTLLVVDRLVKPEFLLEVEAIARLPG